MSGDLPNSHNLRLPRSGLAEDILKMEGHAETTDESVNFASHSEVTKRTHTPSRSIPTRAVPKAALDQSDRIHSFADSLSQSRDDVLFRTRREELEPWVQFKLEGEAFGLPVSSVQEILRVDHLASIAHAPFPIRGTANIRGRVLPVIDLRSRVGLPEAPINDLSRILVATSKGRQLGLLVDSVQQVLQLSRNQIVPPPADVMTPQSDYIIGLYQLEDRLVVLLSIDLVLQIKASQAEMSV